LFVASLPFGAVWKGCCAVWLVGSAPFFAAAGRLTVFVMSSKKDLPVQQRGRPSKVSLQRAQRDLTDRQLAFAVWLSLPEGSRPSRASVAVELGVTENTLWRWAKDPQVQMAARWLVLQNAGDPRRISQVIDVQFQIAMDDSLSERIRLDAARAFLDAVGVRQVWSQENRLLRVEAVEDLDLDSLSDEELWELYEERAGGRPSAPSVAEAQATFGELEGSTTFSGYEDDPVGGSVDSAASDGLLMEDSDEG